jgi:hypothetical protein
MGGGLQTVYEERETKSGTAYAMAGSTESDGGWLSTGTEQYSVMRRSRLSSACLGMWSFRRIMV